MISVRINGKEFTGEAIKEMIVTLSDYGKGTIVEEDRSISHRTKIIGIADRDYAVGKLKGSLLEAFEGCGV